MRKRETKKIPHARQFLLVYNVEGVLPSHTLGSEVVIIGSPVEVAHFFVSLRAGNGACVSNLRNKIDTCRYVLVKHAVLENTMSCQVLRARHAGGVHGTRIVGSRMHAP
jgi:hypothetical protein